MPTSEGVVEIPVTLDDVWRYVANVDRWAPRFPGYQKHQQVSEKESLWWITGDVGILSRELQLRVRITEWQEPTGVSFALEGVEEPVTGHGEFSTDVVGDGVSRLRLALTLEAGGTMAPVINVLLKQQLPKILDGFLTAVADDLQGKAHL